MLIKEYLKTLSEDPNSLHLAVLEKKIDDFEEKEMERLGLEAMSFQIIRETSPVDEMRAKMKEFGELHPDIHEETPEVAQARLRDYLLEHVTIKLLKERLATLEGQ